MVLIVHEIYILTSIIFQLRYNVNWSSHINWNIVWPSLYVFLRVFYTDEYTRTFREVTLASIAQLALIIEVSAVAVSVLGTHSQPCHAVARTLDGTPVIVALKSKASCEVSLNSLETHVGQENWNVVRWYFDHAKCKLDHAYMLRMHCWTRRLAILHFSVFTIFSTYFSVPIPSCEICRIVNCRRFSDPNGYMLIDFNRNIGI